MTYKITSYFKEKESFRDSQHSGIDFDMKDGENLRALEDGVVQIQNYGGENAGLVVKIKFNGGDNELIYGHMQDVTVKTGDIVHKGDLIGHSGHSGHVVSSTGGNGAHLHFGLKNENGEFINPSGYINDIQNMNTPQFAQNVADKVQENQDKIDILKDSPGIYEQIGELFNTLHLIDNTFIIQILKQCSQFFLAHTSFIYSIITSLI
ncbi:M23 family metallopeptidase [Priestia flexa]|uniref:M23 family metallopeptidase n=1 Tax=Priestia flexa TaxID=86664 RepID=UPI0004730ED0|nr:M23 family metallopeptidase [Priestia flexa]